MAINLTKNKDSLLAAWKEVVDDKSKTDWALFGYEGQSNDLKVVSKGAGGVEEMAEDLNSGQIMYAFCRVTDPKTSLPKCVLITWQGEGAPLVRKGTCANHVRDVASFFKGAHVTLNARTEEDVDPQLIIEKVAKSTGSAYSFKERTDVTKDSGPVGTTYKRVIPKQEINTKERDKFWEKEEIEEKRRQEEERKRKAEEQAKLENERKQRELREAAVREQRIRERTESVTQLRQAERSAEQHGRAAERGDEDPGREERERQCRSEVLRKQRNQEAQALISKRTIDARAVFEQNTSAGQLHSLRRTSLGQQPSQEPPGGADRGTAATSPLSAAGKAPLPSWPPEDSAVSPLRDDQNNTTAKKTEEILHPYTNNEESKDSIMSSIISELAAQSEKDYDDEQSPQWNTGGGTTQPVLREALQMAQYVEEEEALAYSNGQGDLGLQARALYDYQAADSTEISFDPGDVITHIDQIDEGWWQGLGPDGTYGLFPANYVELLN
ncbi:drebrin-like protein [Bacillus rossius redtenbacheri]|uniref:drebrin-like protein n=1 Tax=Bacillus rossius redtenbacheri TaxID=93214 RepID=UPI002FDDA23D